MRVVFLTPVAALVGLAALAPLYSAVLRERRDRRLRQALRLGDPRLRTRFASALAAAALVACLAAAAAQPALRVSQARETRTDAQVLFVVDVSRSMLARPGPRGPTRFQRAVALALRLRGALADVPAGVASLSDWTLPHAFPTSNERVFASTLTRAIGINRPRPQLKSRNATDFSALITLGLGNFYGQHAKRRLAILLSDGESREFSLPIVTEALRRGRVGLIVVRLWSRREAVYVGRRRDPGYVPNPAAAAPLKQLAAWTAGHRVFGADEPGGVLRAARSFLGSGPVAGAGRKERTVPLGPYAVLAGILPLALLVRRR